VQNLAGTLERVNVEEMGRGKGYLQIGVHHQLVVLLIRLVADMFSAPWDGLPACAGGGERRRTHRVLDLFLGLFVHVFTAIGLIVIQRCFLPLINIIRTCDLTSVTRGDTGLAPSCVAGGAGGGR
jgi:hypothetical protein